MQELASRKTVLTACKKLLQDQVADAERRADALDYLKKLCAADPDDLEFGEELAFIMQTLVVYPDNCMEITLVDGSTLELSLRRYSLKLGWRRDETITLAERALTSRIEQTGAAVSIDAGKQVYPDVEAQKSRLMKELRQMIDSLRRQDLGYKRIANELRLNENTIKSYCHRHPLAEKPPQPDLNELATIVLCKNCGKEVVQVAGRKAKKFFCRIRWWNAHPDQIDRKKSAMYQHTCKRCGKEFVVYGNWDRKYCCHDCYIRDQFGEE